MPAPNVDTEAAVGRLMQFLSVEGVTGKERAIAEAVRGSLLTLGVPANAIHFDTANERIPVPTETGNLWVHLPGNRTGPHLLFMTHLDTVPLAAGAKPVREGERICPAGRTALGGDDRTGVAVLVTLVAELRRQNLPHGPITLLFTVREESGLYGARHLDPADLAGIEAAYNVDGRAAADLTIGAVGAIRWNVEVRGRAAHAGVHPEQGISATAVTALAVADVFRGGWFGKVRKPGPHGGTREGTSNVGVVSGADGRPAGDATNVVTDHVHVRGESRSFDAAFVEEITDAYRRAFLRAAGEVRDDKGRPAEVTFEAQLDYHSFRLPEDGPAVERARRAVAATGLTPTTKTTNGGLDANWVVRHGVPCITFGAGQNEIHTVEEFVDLAEFERGCRVALALAAGG